MRTDLALTVEFLNAVGMPCVPRVGANGFLTGILIERGTLLFDDARAKPSDLLHEAGHLAIAPARFRPWFERDVSAGVKSMLDAVDFSDPDSPEARAALNCSDSEATAWAWAAGKAIGLPPTSIITDEQYGGDGRSIRAMLLGGSYAGIHGLAHAGLCAARPGRYADACGLPAYPQLARWLQR